jgi:hypothetical protein
MPEKKKTSPVVYALIVAGLAVLTAGMGVDGRAGIVMTVAAIVIFVVAIALSLAGGFGQGTRR